MTTRKTDGNLRITVVMPPSMYNAIKDQANEDMQIIGECLRDIVRDYLDTQKNLIPCEDDDCEFLVDKRLGYCPNCGSDVTFEEPDDDEDDDDEDDE